MGSKVGVTSGVCEIRGHSLVLSIAHRGGQDLRGPAERREKLH